MEKIIRCPDCNAPVDRHDIYIERNRIYCRRACGGVNQDFPNLAQYELPPPKKMKKPKDMEKDIVFKSDSNSIDVTFKRYGKAMGIFLIVFGLVLISVGFIFAYINISGYSPTKLDIRSIDPSMLGVFLIFTIIGFYVILKGLWEMKGGCRVYLDRRVFIYGKVFGNMWFKKKYNVIQLLEIRKYLQKISDRKYYYRIGFFVEGKKKPMYPKFNSSEEEIDWLVYQFYSIWKPNSQNIKEEADLGEV